MKITVTAERPENDKVAATVTVPAAEVDKAIAKTYKDIARRYQFQGFRRGRAPRPVIDGILGREAVLAEATNNLLTEVQPLMIDELDIVPIDRPDYGEDADLVAPGTDYVVNATIAVTPLCELDSYDAPAIQMPPADATDAEIELQVNQLLSYQMTFEDIEEDRPVQEDDIVSCDIENKNNCAEYAGKNRMLSLAAASLPEALVEGIIGMSKGETKAISWERTHTHDDEELSASFECEVTINAIRKQVIPELTDELAKNSFGFETVAELRDAVKEEIEDDKKRSLPGLKEDRVVEAIGPRLELEDIPEAYENQVFNELANEFLGQLQNQGMSLDGYLKARNIESGDFVADLHEQAKERARQSLALDALAAHLDIEVTEDEVRAEFERAGVGDVRAAMAEFAADGRMPAIRESIRRSKAVKWLTDNAIVTEVDEVAERVAEAEAE